MKVCEGGAGAPRPMKMGTTRSPWRYDNHAEDAIRTTAMRAGCRGYAPIFGLEAIAWQWHIMP
jgi:hypothetical protein